LSKNTFKNNSKKYSKSSNKSFDNSKCLSRNERSISLSKSKISKNDLITSIDKKSSNVQNEQSTQIISPRGNFGPKSYLSNNQESSSLTNRMVQQKSIGNKYFNSHLPKVTEFQEFNMHSCDCHRKCCKEKLKVLLELKKRKKILVERTRKQESLQRKYMNEKNFSLSYQNFYIQKKEKNAYY